MIALRIAALFDAENVGCDIAVLALRRLRQIGTLQSACAVGDFTTFKQWIDCGRDNGIELVMQPSLGKGKNSADIALAIEAMDIAYRGHVDAIALISRDRDFTPLALRLRAFGLTVIGLGGARPNAAFVAACHSFEVLVPPQQASPQTKPVSPAELLSDADFSRIRQIVSLACAGGPIHHSVLVRTIISEAPAIATKLSGKGQFLKTLVANKLVQRVGSGDAQLFRSAA